MDAAVKYDIVVIGSGMGGLACANILSQNGYKVIVLEKNIQAGGNLQSFGVKKVLFDTGVHYIGGLGKGQSLYPLFRYFGIYDQLQLVKMDEDGFDQIHFYKEDEWFPYAMGFDHFEEQMISKFPEEAEGIRNYIQEVKHCIQSLPLAGLDETGDWRIPDIDFRKGAKEFIDENINNQKLRNILSAPNMLYGGNPKTPFYFHALVLNGYLESAWRFKGGTAQIARLMTKEIQRHGGKVKCGAEVVSSTLNEAGEMQSVTLANGEVIQGKCFISNLHPEVTIKTLGEEHFSKRFLQRFGRYKNTGSVFVVNLVFKKNSFRYLNYNIFQVNTDKLWVAPDEKPGDGPLYFFIAFPPPVDGSDWAGGMTIITAMDFDEVSKWSDTFHTTKSRNSRDEDYQKFKEAKAALVVDAIEKVFPGIKDAIEAIDCMSPLTFRDYTYTPNGSAYGYIKDTSSPLQAFMSPRTSIPNLYLTGQNIAAHGILGVCFSALLTCFQLVDRKKLLNEINALRYN